MANDPVKPIHTVAELREYARANGTEMDIFYTTDLRYPPGVLVPRDEAQIQRWLDDVR